MVEALPGGKEASYRLLGLQLVAHEGGVILKRGTTRLFLEGDGIAELIDVLVARLADGRAVAWTRLVADVGTARREALARLVDTLKAHRFIVEAGDQAEKAHGREDVFFWNYQTSFSEIVGELAEIPLTVFGVNTIGLALLGNLRGCGFRDMTFVDHPALRNIDYYDARQTLRREISGALSVPPVMFDDWSAADAKPDGCLVVCCDFGGRPLMRDWNRYCVGKGVLFYPIVLLDHVAHLGPLVRPGDGPCYECLWARQDANLANAALVRAGEVEPEFGQQAVGYLQPMARAAADFAAIDLLKTFSKSLSENPLGRMIEIDLLGPRVINRDLVKVPQCPVCSPAPEPEILTASPEIVAAAPASPDTDAEIASSDEPAKSVTAEEAAESGSAEDRADASSSESKSEPAEESAT